MKNRKREICTSGSVRDEAGQPPHLLGHRRQFLHLAAGAAALPAASRIALAQTYPTRPVIFIVPFPRGGLSDIFARLMGQWLSERLGQPFIIENRPGANTNIAVEAVAKSAPDGYTFLRRRLVGCDLVSALYEKVGNDLLRNTAPVASIARGPFVMLVNPSFPARLPEFISYAKANPGQVNMASNGTGTTSTCGRRTFQVDGRSRHGARALWRRCACVDQPARWPSSGHLR